jgi:tetratricopeptide (TPR) repeat protein
VPATTEELLNEAILLHRQGRRQDAQSRYEEILRTQPDHASALHLLGVLKLQEGDARAAADLITRAIERSPASAAYHNNLGNAQKALGAPAAALSSYRQAIELDGRLVSARTNLGLVLRELGRLVEARAVLERAHALNPDDAALLNQLASVLHASGEIEPAIDLWRRALDVKADQLDACENLARVLRDLGRNDAAAAEFRRAITLKPLDPSHHNDLGTVLVRGRRLDEADACFRRATELDPRFALALYNRGVIALEQRRFDDAMALFRRALEIKPDLAGPRDGIGAVLCAEGKFADAAAIEEEEVRRFPQGAAARTNYALTLLTLGRFDEGWKYYEHRLESAEVRTASGPPWHGEPLGENSLLVFAEQGAGDNIQFIRYLERVRAEQPRARIVYPVQEPLRRLLTPYLAALGVELPSYRENVAVHGFQTALLSLPRVYGTTLQSIPSRAPYLRVARGLRDAWAQKVSAIDAVRVGLCWAGNPAYAGDAARSVPFESFTRLLALPGIAFVSLQKDGGAVHAGRLLDWMDDVRDFADTAALIGQLDLVISVDTSVAHLAGALAKPVWLLNRVATDWRWLLGRSDSPWYPTMRIFRQEKLDDWRAPLDEACAALMQLSSARRKP